MICVHLNLEAAVRCLHSLNIICEWKFINPNRHWIYASPLFAWDDTWIRPLSHGTAALLHANYGTLGKQVQDHVPNCIFSTKGGKFACFLPSKIGTPFWTHTTAAATTICCARDVGLTAGCHRNEILANFWKSPKNLFILSTLVDADILYEQDELYILCGTLVLFKEQARIKLHLVELCWICKII